MIHNFVTSKIASNVTLRNHLCAQCPATVFTTVTGQNLEAEVEGINLPYRLDVACVVQRTQPPHPA
eukprot:4548882-Amphidinium_carterae.1